MSLMEVGSAGVPSKPALALVPCWAGVGSRCSTFTSSTSSPRSRRPSRAVAKHVSHKQRAQLASSTFSSRFNREDRESASKMTVSAADIGIPTLPQVLQCSRRSLPECLLFTGSATADVRNDTPRPFAGMLTVVGVHLEGSAADAEVELVSAPVQLEAGGGSLVWVDVSKALSACPPSSCVLISRVTSFTGSSTAPVAENVQMQLAPFELKLPKAKVSFTIGTGSCSRCR